MADFGGESLLTEMRVPLRHANIGVAELLCNFSKGQSLPRPSARGGMPQFVERQRLNFSGLALCLHEALGAVLFPLLGIVCKYEVVTTAFIAHGSEELGCLRIQDQGTPGAIGRSYCD